MHLADEPQLDEAHWPMILSVVAGKLITMSKDLIDPGVALGLVMESALVASRLDPELVDPGRWKLAPGRAGLQIAKADAFRRI